MSEPSADRPAPTDGPKIIIDEDWKSRVQAEKEALEKQHPAHEPAASAGPATPQGQPPGAERHVELPPATLPVLLTTLATQALVAMGQITHDPSGKVESRLDEAKHFIDLLEMLEQKTAGNRTPDESRLLDNLLHELRMTYVSVKG
jgi:hypothetical protein